MKYACPDLYAVNATREFLKLSWDDDRNADEIIDSIMKDRKNKRSFGAFNGVFDWRQYNNSCDE
jgi:hypothetical protein